MVNQKRQTFVGLPPAREGSRAQRRDHRTGELRPASRRPLRPVEAGRSRPFDRFFSGARGNWTLGLEETEASLFARRALSLGVPAEAIFQEDQSTNLGQNIAKTRTFLEAKGLARTNLLLVTKPNTERRAWATAMKVWPAVHWGVTSPDTRLEGPYAPGRSFEDLVNEMVGDLERILNYPGLGFQITQPVPQEVLEAFEALKDAGFDRHLMKP